MTRKSPGLQAGAFLGKKKSARRGSNPRTPPWQGGVVPLYYSRVQDALYLIMHGMSSRFSDIRSAQSRNRTNDTGIFSPLLYQLSYLGEVCVTPCRRPGSNRYGYHYPRDFKSRASASSATPAVLSDTERGLPSFQEWAEVDSNHRSNLQQIYSLSPLATRESAHNVLTKHNNNITVLKKQALFSLFQKCGAPLKKRRSDARALPCKALKNGLLLEYRQEDHSDSEKHQTDQNERHEVVLAV